MNKQRLKIVDADWLEQLRVDILNDSDYNSVQKKFKWLIEHYQILNYHLEFSQLLWRARICSNEKGYDTLSELSAPPCKYVKQPGRLNDTKESIFYASFHKHTTFAEVGAKEGDYIHIAGYKIIKPLRCCTVGDYFKSHRSGNTLVSNLAGREISRMLSKIAHKHGIGLILMDAFFSEVLSDRNARNNSYIYSRALGRQIIQKLNTVNALLYPSIVSEHAMNIAIKNDQVCKTLEIAGNSVVKIIKRYEYGIFDFELVRESVGYLDDGTILWK